MQTHDQFSLQKEHTSPPTIMPISVSEKAQDKIREDESSNFFFSAVLPPSNASVFLGSQGLSTPLSSWRGTHLHKDIEGPVD